MKTTRKQLTFDLDTKVAKEILGESYNGIYDKIERFFKKRNFEHIEGTVYASKNPISSTKIKYLISDLKDKYPYLDKCVRDIRETNITSHHSLNNYFNYDGTAGEFAKEENKTMPMDKIKEVANQARENKSNSLTDKSNSKSKGKNEKER